MAQRLPGTVMTALVVLMIVVVGAFVWCFIEEAAGRRRSELSRADDVAATMERLQARYCQALSELRRR